MDPAFQHNKEDLTINSNILVKQSVAIGMYSATSILMKQVPTHKAIPQWPW